MPIDPEKKTQNEFDKLDLEVKKLRRDSRMRPFSDRERFWSETIRVVGIAAITGVVTYIVNTKTEDVRKDNSFDIEEYKVFLTRRSAVFDKALTFAERQRLACLVTDQYKNSNSSDIQLELKDIAEICKKDSVVQVAQGTLLQSAPVVEQQVSQNYVKQIAEAEKQTRAIEQLLKAKSNDAKLLERQKKLDRKLDSLIFQNVEVNDLSKKSIAVTENFKSQATIVNNEIKQAAIVSERVPAAGYPWTSWFKEGGYFLVFDDMKITLDDIENNSSIRVSVCHSTTPQICAPGDQIKLESDKITTESPARIQRDGFEYVIRLDRVGSAGRNPFTKAAYITFEKYKL